MRAFLDAMGLLWPRVGWAAVLVGFAFGLTAVVATGALLALVGYGLRLRRIVRPVSQTGERDAR